MLRPILRRTRIVATAAAATLASFVSIARAQQPVFTMAATEPSTGVFMFREQVQYFSLRRDPTGLGRDVNEWRSHSMIAYGLTPDVSLSLTVPVIFRDIDSKVPGVAQDIGGFDAPMLMADWRIYQNHTGPVDTVRLSLMTGAKIPSGDPDISAGSVEPMLGLIYTLIRGRNGLDLALQYQFNTGGFEHPIRAGDGKYDTVYYDAAYLYRLAPEQYEAGTRGAWYATAEMNGVYELNGDNEILLSPGLMYEGGNFALEFGVQLPVWQEIENRPKTNFSIVMGFRWLF